MSHGAPFGRTAMAGVAVLASLFVTFAVTSGTGGAAQGAPIEPGIGSALGPDGPRRTVVRQPLARLRLRPFDRRPSNTVAQASSQAIDLGQVGATLAGARL